MAGDPIADACFVFCMQKVRQDAWLRLRHLGHDDQIDFNGRTLDSGQPNLEKIQVPEISYIDNIAIVVTADTLDECQQKTAQVITVVQDEMLDAGMEINVKKGKTEIMLHKPPFFTEKDKLASNRLRSTGLHFAGGMINVVDSCAHLGILQVRDGALLSELRRRAAYANAAVTQHMKTLKAPWVTAQHKHRLISTLIQSVLLHGSQTWGPMNEKMLDIIRRPYYRAAKMAMGITHKDKVPDLIMQTHGFVDIKLLVARRRLQYLGRMMKHGPQSLIALTQAELHDKDGWPAAVWMDFDYMKQMDEECQSCHTWRQWSTLVTAGNWDARVKKVFQNDFYVLKETPEGPDIQDGDGWLCHCGKWCKNLHALHGHRVSAHNYRCWAMQFVTEDATCRICMVHYGHPARLHKHLVKAYKGVNGVRHDSCLGQMMLRRLPRAQPQQLEEIRQSIRDKTKENKRRGRSLLFADEYAAKAQGPQLWDREEVMHGPLPNPDGATCDM
eukprot:TRINITY_DN28748_c0_g2_i1.p1 TRINITY_DN28748_c0_g2~~TRINITY_DN28748_c0_g2_i1.p1  ORF type:complete len:518 (+),score=72.60 TRINITY_DN28748_c0_g2_i1:59-1555(+)